MCQLSRYPCCFHGNGENARRIPCELPPSMKVRKLPPQLTLNRVSKQACRHERTILPADVERERSALFSNCCMV